MEWQLLEQVTAHLREFGFAVEDQLVGSNRVLHPDATILIRKNSHEEVARLEFKAHLTLSAIASSEEDSGPEVGRRIYVSNYINARTASAFRHRGVQFLDSGGNAFLHSPAWLIDIRGREPEPLWTAPRMDSPPGQLYSSRRAQVIVALITWPQLLDAPLRDVCTAAGVSLGLAQSTLNALKYDEALWPTNQRARDRLIDGWASAFPGSLGRSLELGTAHADDVGKPLVDALPSGESAIPQLIRAAKVVAYVPEITPHVLAANRWRADGAPNVVIKRQFWQDPSQGEPARVPPILVYGDLVASSDPRVRIAAAEYREQL